MDRETWLKQEAALSMFDYIRKRPYSQRKMRLFAADMCREDWYLLPDRLKEAVEVAELYADARASDDDLRRANGLTGSTDADRLAELYMGTMVFDATSPNLRPEAISRFLHNDNIFQADRIAEVFGNPFENHVQELYTQNVCRMCGFDSFGSKPRPKSCKASHVFEPIAPSVTPRVLAIARTIYEDRAFESLPILADALEEEGCTSAAILEHFRKQPKEYKCRHCRGLGYIQVAGLPHYTCWSCSGERMISRMPRHTRGCWALDLVLGSSLYSSRS